jgi:uncharacterized protein
MRRTTSSAGALLREARTEAGLTQRELARRAGVSQSVISAYEAERRQPSLPTLVRLVEATGGRLETSVRRSDADPPRRLGGRLGQRLQARRTEVIAAAARHGVANVRVFGSVARGVETADSDIDLLVDLPDGASLFSIARLQRELEEILRARVEIVPASDLKPDVRTTVDGDLVAL